LIPLKHDIYWLQFSANLKVDIHKTTISKPRSSIFQTFSEIQNDYFVVGTFLLFYSNSHQSTLNEMRRWQRSV